MRLNDVLVEYEKYGTLSIHHCAEYGSYGLMEGSVIKTC